MDPLLKPRSRRCRCAACGLYFGGVKGFDKHRTGAHGTPERRCLTPEEMLRAGLVQNGVWWITVYNGPGPRRIDPGSGDRAKGVSR